MGLHLVNVLVSSTIGIQEAECSIHVCDFRLFMLENMLSFTHIRGKKGSLLPEVRAALLFLGFGIGGGIFDESSPSNESVSESVKKQNTNVNLFRSNTKRIKAAVCM